MRSSLKRRLRTLEAALSDRQRCQNVDLFFIQADCEDPEARMEEFRRTAERTGHDYRVVRFVRADPNRDWSDDTAE